MKQFSYIHIVSTDTESSWLTELTLVLPFLAKVTQVLAILSENQDLVLVRIDNINVSLSIKVYVSGFLELAWDHHLEYQMIGQILSQSQTPVLCYCGCHTHRLGGYGIGHQMATETLQHLSPSFQLT